MANNRIRTNKISNNELYCLYKKVNPSKNSLILTIFIFVITKIKYNVDKDKTKIGKLNIGILCWLGVRAKK